MALDKLLPRYHYDKVLILHTDPTHSDISQAYNDLMAVLKADYPTLEIGSHTLGYANGKALTDISDQHSAEAYYHALLELICQYRIHYIPIHLLIAGGRKAMSIYAALAAELLFGEHDRLWAIHSSPTLIQSALFHAPVGMQDHIQIIQLPIRPSRLLPATIMGEDIQHLLERLHTSPRQAFLHALTEEESNLAECLHQHPYAGNDELGRILGKSSKTVENQLRSIYSKLFTYFDLNIEDKRKRQALQDVLAGRV